MKGLFSVFLPYPLIIAKIIYNDLNEDLIFSKNIPFPPFAKGLSTRLALLPT